MTSLARSHSPPTPPNRSHSTSPPPKRPRLDSPSAPPLATTASPIASTSRLPYDQGLHLAPMVRIGTLPARLLALEYGAELVWGPEIVDKAIIGCERVVDPKSGTIRFLKNNRSIFECHPLEKSRLIFQLGSADPELAVQAAKVIQGDVAGVGLNCGCPKPFSISGGMGAALLKVPEKLCSILRALVTSIPLPIDVKIRLFPTPLPTFTLVSQLLETGVSALTVHCRTQEMRSSEPAMLDRLKEIVEMGEKKGVTVIANGDGVGWSERERIMELTGVKSIMIARGAEANPSCFDPAGLSDPVSIVIPQFIRLAIAVNNPYGNSKYILNSINPSLSPSPPSKEIRSKLKVALNQAKSYEQMGSLFGIGVEEVEEMKEVKVEELVPRWTVRARRIAEEEEGKKGEGVVVEKESEQKVVVEVVEEKAAEVVV